jgi:hypothetical protein
MTKPQEHGHTPNDIKAPIYRHASDGPGKADNDAGGQVDPAAYQVPIPQGPKPPPNLSETDEADPGF